MGSSNARIVIGQLKQEWIEVEDASVYRELELEKQLWMLSALKMLGDQQRLWEESPELHTTSQKPIKVLSLYENHGKLSRNLLWNETND